MGASRHCRHGVLRDGLDLAAERADRRAGAHVRRVRQRAGSLTSKQAARALLAFLLAASAPLVALRGQGTRPDSTRADTSKRAAVADSASSAKRTLTPTDTVKAVKLPPRDTIKTPIARPYVPRSTEIGASNWHWDRDQLFASGAMSMGDLLSSVPGVTLITTGFLLAPQVAAYYGDPGRVRLFLDGVELDAINPRNGGIPDLALVPLWSLEDVKVERAAGELRVHMRLWRVDRIKANTRVDVVTGTENLNLYRGFFGKRFDNGLVLQLAGQQQSSVSIAGMDGDGLGGLARLGWARGDWSVDATWIHQGLNRNAGDRFINTTPQLRTLPAYFGSEGMTYVRIAWRDPELNGPWAQFIAATLSEAKGDTTGSLTSTLAGGSAKDSTDTTTSRSQYILAAGITRWGIRLSSTNRLRSIKGKSYFSPGVRAEYESRLLTLSAFAEKAIDSTTRTDVLGRFAPFSWLNVGGSLSRSSPNAGVAGAITTNTRLEVGVQWRNRWLTGGVVTRTASFVAPPIEFVDTTLHTVLAPAANGVLFSFRGPLLYGVNLDVDAINWSVPGPYRAQTQARARLWFESGFLHRFPRNNFHLFVSGTYDYSSAIFVPSGTDPLGANSAGAGIISALLEIRIASANIFYQVRNPVGVIYSTYPGYTMPKLVNMYGVRWQFWN